MYGRSNIDMEMQGPCQVLTTQVCMERQPTFKIVLCGRRGQADDIDGEEYSQQVYTEDAAGYH